MNVYVPVSVRTRLPPGNLTEKVPVRVPPAANTVRVPCALVIVVRSCATMTAGPGTRPVADPMTVSTPLRERFSSAPKKRPSTCLTTATPGGPGVRPDAPCSVPCSRSVPTGAVAVTTALPVNVPRAPVNRPVPRVTSAVITKCTRCPARRTITRTVPFRLPDELTIVAVPRYPLAVRPKLATSPPLPSAGSVTVPAHCRPLVVVPRYATCASAFTFTGRADAAGAAHTGGGRPHERGQNYCRGPAQNSLTFLRFPSRRPRR